MQMTKTNKPQNELVRLCHLYVTRNVITSYVTAMALPDWTITLVASASLLLCFLFLCVRHKRTGQVFWRRLLSKIMARTEKPLFRIA